MTLTVSGGGGGSNPYVELDRKKVFLQLFASMVNIQAEAKINTTAFRNARDPLVVPDI